MKNLKHIAILAIVLLSFFELTAANDLKSMAESMIRDIMQKSVNLKFEKINIGPNKKKIEKRFRQRFYKSWLYFWQVSDINKTIAYAILDNVYGKSQPITFITVFDTQGNIIGCRIVKYREPHGNEVKNLKWLAKFEGKNSTSLFKKGDDIDGISGATISSASIIKGNGKLSYLIKDLISRYK